MAGSGVARSWADSWTSTRQRLDTAGQAPWPSSGTRQGAQELPPAGVGVPDRRWWDAVVPEDPADRRCADAVAECEQFALDVESAWGAVAGFPRPRFPRPL